jgi:hypothetical protein
MSAGPHLILHVGTHKTGTTSQQSGLHRDRSRLSAQGIRYADEAPFLGGRGEAHFKTARLLAEPQALPAELLAFRADMLARAADHDVTVLSAETFCRHALGWADGRPHYLKPTDLDDPLYRARRIAYLERVAEFFAPFRVSILIWFRDLEGYADSGFKQWQFETAPYRSFAECLALTRHRFAYDAHIALLEAHFDDVRVRLFEDAVKVGPYPAILRECGLDAAAPAAAVHARPSPTNRAAQWATRRFGGRNLSRREGDRLLDFARSAEARAVFAGPETSLWPDPDARRAFADAHVSARLPSVNVRREVEPAIVPWTAADHLRAEAAYRRWRLREVLVRASRRLGGARAPAPAR